MIDAVQSPAPPRRIALLIGVAAIVLAADVGSKVAVVAMLPGRRHVRLCGGVLTLLVARNPGAAFGLGGPSVTAACTAIGAGVAVFIVRYSRHISSTPWAVGLGLLLGGAMGNLSDRLFRSPGPLQGWVVDWIRFSHWPTFNLADSAIACGTALVAVLAARGTGAPEVYPARRDGDYEPGPPPSPMLVLVPVEPGPAPVPGPAGPAGPAGPP
jgi:signal peptidase II